MRQLDEKTVQAIGGPDALDLFADVDLHVEDCAARATFSISEGEKVAFVAAYRPSHVTGERSGLLVYAEELVERTDEFWRAWVGRCDAEGRYRDAQVRSLLTLKA
ncbi:MAG: glycoside hydrolase family 15 protein, partial [Actinomycetota bacterium]|nr:glycoside hydrolase family 15 protein [Actinomycetota bacterium]